MIRTTIRTLALALGLLVPLAGCDGDGFGVEGESQVLLSRGSVDATASVVPAFLGEALAAQVPLSAVEAITIDVTSVQLLPAGADGDADADWVVLDLEEGALVSLNLLDLPTTGGIPIASANLQEGATFSGLRLFFEEPATITFDETVSTGPQTLAPGTYPLFIPSGMQAGVRVNDNFRIDRSGEDIVVNFDADASVRQIVLTGAGTVIMPPVLGVEED